MRKRIAWFLINCVAPEIQPCVCLIEPIALLCKALCNVSGQAEEAVGVCGVYGLAAHAGLTGASDHPVGYFIGKFFS